MGSAVLRKERSRSSKQVNSSKFLLFLKVIICIKIKNKCIYLFFNFRQAHHHSHQSAASSSNINNRFSNNSKSTNDQHVANNSGSPVNPNNLDRAPPGGQHDNNFAELGSVHTDGIFRKVRDLLKIK